MRRVARCDGVSVRACLRVTPIARGRLPAAAPVLSLREDDRMTHLEVPEANLRMRLEAGVTRRIRVNTRYLAFAAPDEKPWRVIEVRPDGSELCEYYDDVTILGPSTGVVSNETGRDGKARPCAWIETSAALYVR